MDERTSPPSSAELERILEFVRGQSKAERDYFDHLFKRTSYFILAIITVISAGATHLGLRAQRQQVLAAAYTAHPERFVKGRPQPADLPTAVWINSPAKKTTAKDAPGTTIVMSDDLQAPRSRPRLRRP